MSTTQNEGLFAAELRALADLEQPALDLDPAVALRVGRVRRRRLVAARCVGALAVLAGLGVGVAQLGATGPSQRLQRGEPRLPVGLPAVSGLHGLEPLVLHRHDDLAAVLRAHGHLDA